MMRHTKYALYFIVFSLVILLTVYAAFASKTVDREVTQTMQTDPLRITDLTKQSTSTPSGDTTRIHPLVVVHLGDSHVQAGYFSQPIRRMLADRYGSAGYGWLSPHRLAGTNQNEHYRLSASPSRWRSTRITVSSGYDCMGPGGLMVYPESSRVNCSVDMRDGSHFRELLVYRTKSAPSLQPEGPYRYEIFRADSASNAMIVADTIRFAAPLSSVSLFADGCKADDGYAGFKAIDSSKGCLFDEIGNNGAMYTQYATSEYVRSLALLQPDVLVVSLGTNESMGRSFSSSTFSEQIDSFFRLVSKYLPHTRIVMTTPPPNYRANRIKVGNKKQRIGKKKGKKARYRMVPNYKTVYSINPNVCLAGEAIKSYADKHNYRCIDLYELIGGKDGGQKWIDQGLYARDRVHFSVEGYRRQGELVAQALKSLI